MAGPHQLALAAAGVLIAAAALSAPAPADLKAGWLGVALPLMAAGPGLLPLTRQVAVAGVHFIVLGPLLLSLWPRRPRAALRWLYLGLVALMCAAILLQDLAWRPWLPALAAAGCGVAASWGVRWRS